MTSERLRELEWAAEYVANHPARRGCRCGGSCEQCRELSKQTRHISPATVLELVREIRRLDWGRPLDAAGGGA